MGNKKHTLTEAQIQARAKADPSELKVLGLIPSAPLRGPRKPRPTVEGPSETEAALRDVLNGADVYGRADAMLYRELEKLGLVNICEAMQAPKDGAKRQPYFGCIITVLGRKVLTESKLRRVSRNTAAQATARAEGRG